MSSPTRLLAISLGLANGLGCATGVPQAPGSSYESPSTDTAPSATSVLLSANATGYGKDGGPDDTLVLVFAAEVDPLGVVPEAFGVVRADGQRVRAIEAWVGPADESDENRSVVIIGEFGQLGAEPVAVHVIDRLFTESGGSLEGLDVEIRALERPDQLIVVERLPTTEDRCPGAKQVLRTYWTDSLADVRTADVPGIELVLVDGTRVAPIGFDDHSQPDDLGQGGDDNVLDLCVEAASDVVHLTIIAGRFTDPLGHATAAADIDVPAGGV